MLGRISRGLAHKKAGRVKYRFDVVVEKLDNLPGPVKKCRVVWSRGPKLQMTDIKDVHKGAVIFKQKLSQIATMYQDAKGGFEPKEYTFQVQVPGKEDNKLLTVGRAELDMSHYVLADGTPQAKMIPMMFKVGMASTGYLKVTITAEVVASGGESDDGMTEVSGMTGMTANLGEEQDLSGFGDEERSAQAGSGRQSGANIRPSSRVSGAGTSPAKPDNKAAASTASSSSPVPGRGKASAKAAAAAMGHEDDEISPMSLSPLSSGGASPRESSKPTRAAGKPSVVDRTAAADARAQLFGTAPGKPSKVAASPSSGSSSSRADPPLSEDEARAALFSATPSSSKPSSSQRASAEPAGASTKSATAAGKKAAPVSSISPSTSAEPSLRPSAAALDTASGSSTAAAPRRALLDRSAPQDKLRAQAAASTADTGPSSSKQQPRTPQGAYGHSLSDSDEDSSPQQQTAQGGRVQQAAAARAARQQGTAAPFSRTKQQPSQQQPPSTQQAAASSSSAAAAVMASENEKLKAQLMALRQQAADAEEARRMAVLAADNAASERDEFRDRAQELQEQLKEALAGLVSDEDAAGLKQQLQSQQQQLHAQQQQQQQVAQQQLHDAELQAWQVERGTLQQQLADAQLAAQKAQQVVEQHAQQLQQLQADTDSHAGLMRHLSWQLEAAQHALQQQQQEQEAEPQPPSHAGADSADPPGPVPAQPVVATDQQWPTVLQFLADEVQTLSQHDLVHQCLTAELLQDAVPALAALAINSAVQGPVLEVLGGLRAARAALEQQEAEQASQKTSVEALTAALAQSQAANELLQQQCSSQTSLALGTAVDMQALAAELAQLRDENARLANQGQQQPGSPAMNAAKPSTLPSGHSVLSKGLAAAIPTLDASCKVCPTLREQLTAAQHKNIKLTAARDKLEIILHDMEAAALEEQQQLQQQLAAANKALRSTGQQVTAAKQQLTHTQHELADAQQQLAEAKVRQAANAQSTAVQQPQVDKAAGERQLWETAATTGSEAATPPAVGAQAQVIAMAESAGPSGVELALTAAQEQVADLQLQLAEADSVRRGLEKELSRARKQLADEQCERSTLEEHMVTRLEDMGDEVAQETVAAYEAKYSRLKSRYRELTELHREEVDKLHDEIGTLQEQVVELEALAAQLEAARSQAQHGEVTLADTLAKASKASSELAALRAENQMLTQNLISLKLELALCCEREVIGRHELYKSRETNLKLASKMTKLEVNAYANKK